MKAMLLRELGSLDVNRNPLRLEELPDPAPAESELLVRISACGVCHTDLDEIEGRMPPVLPVVPGHQVVGRVVETGSQAGDFRAGDRVGIAWIYSACGRCRYCLEGKENLCRDFKATGRDVNGGYAECMTVPSRFAYHLPPVFSDIEAAPLLCAGAIGYRSLRLSGLVDGEPLGLTGFGASAHLVLKMARHRFPKSEVYVFARGENEKAFARELGAVWTGEAHEESPVKLRAVIDTTPAWNPVVEALKNLEPGGKLVVNAIRKDDADKNCLLRLDYAAHLWLEKEIQSVANVTRADVREFLDLAAEIPIRPETEVFGLHEANHALMELKQGKIRGGKVLRIG